MRASQIQSATRRWLRVPEIEQERRARLAILRLRQLRAGLVQPAIGPGIVARHAAQMFEHHGGTASRRDAGQERPSATHGQGPGQIRQGRYEPVGGPPRRCRSAALRLRTARDHGFRMPPSARSAAPEGFSCLLQRFGAGDADVAQQVVVSRSRARRARARSCQARRCSTIAMRRPSVVDHNLGSG